MARYCAALVSAFALVALGHSEATAQTASTVPSGASVYIEEMDNDLDGYLRAELTKQKVPLRVVLRREDAHLVLTGTSTGERKRSWHEVWLTAEQDRTSGNVMVFDRTTKTLLWAGEAGDRSLLWGSLARGGTRKVAGRLAKSLKKAVRASGTPLPEPPPLSVEEAQSETASGPETVAPGAPDGRSANAAVLTNADIVKMVAAGLSDEVILQAIKASPSQFTTTPDALVELKTAKVTDVVIAAMIAAHP